MIAKNKIKVMALIGAAALGVAYKAIDSYFNRNIDSIMQEKGYVSEWVTLLPGKSDKILDIYLENMKNYSSQYMLEGIERAVDFAGEHNPKRLEETYTKAVDFLLENNEIEDAMYYATRLKKHDSKNNNDILIKKVNIYSNR